MSHQIRQGDVMLIKLSNNIGGSEMITTTGRLVLATGEKSGHAHILEAVDLRTIQVGPLQFVVADEEMTLLHVDGAGVPDADHATLVVEPGTYEVKLQQEYQEQSPATLRTNNPAINA